MRNPEFESFISVFGEATYTTEVPETSLEKYRGILPDKLLLYWKEEGWSAYGNGLFWTVNPEEFEGVLSMWLEHTGISDIDAYHVFARTAFGNLIVWGQNTNQYFTIDSPIHKIFLDKDKLEKSEFDPEVSIGGFFILSEKEDYDLENDSGEFMFERVLDRCGVLTEGEMYAFEPALALGGTSSIENISKAPILAHLAVLSQLAPIEIVGYDTSSCV